MSMKNRNPLTKLTGDAALSRPKLGRLESTPNVRQSAFFNLSVLIGLVVSLCGVFLPPLAFGTLSEMSTSAALSGPDPVIVRVTEMRALRGRGVVEGDTIWASVWSTSTTGLRLAPRLTTMAASSGARRTHLIYGQNKMEHRRCASCKAISIG